MNQDNANRESSASTDWVESWYQEHGAFIESVIKYASGNSQESDDIYQEVLISLMTLKRPEKIVDIRDYLYVLTINKVKEFRRRKSRVKQILEGYASHVLNRTEHREQNTALVYEETEKMLETIKTCLSRKEAQAVLLRYHLETENELAAKTMQIDKNTFSRYVSVGISKIRNIVQSKQKAEE